MKQFKWILSFSWFTKMPSEFRFLAYETISYFDQINVFFKQNLENLLDYHIWKAAYNYSIDVFVCSQNCDWLIITFIKSRQNWSKTHYVILFKICLIVCLLPPIGQISDNVRILMTFFQFWAIFFIFRQVKCDTPRPNWKLKKGNKPNIIFSHI